MLKPVDLHLLVMLGTHDASAYNRAHELTKEVIGACIEVHRFLGPGLIESVYERCLLRELELRGLKAINQRRIRVEYKGLVFEEELRFDVFVEGCLLVEVKAVENTHPVHKAVLMAI
jgi:GxxExxY protein